MDLISADDTFWVSGRNALVLRPGMVVVDRSVPTRASATAATAEPGDTVFPLDYLGEGRYNVWYDGGIVWIEAFLATAGGRRVS